MRESDRNVDARVRPVILIVEDDPGMRGYLRDCLEALDVSVVTDRSGTEALERLRADDRGYDLVITDLRLAGIDGLELIQEIERDPVLRDLPVLVVTGEPVESGTAGGRPVLPKPFRGSLLRTYVSELLHDGQGDGPC